MDVDISKASLYKIIFHYHNPGFDQINADVTVTPENSLEATQSGNIILPSTNRPKHQSVLNQFVLNSGRWTISLKTPQRLYVVSVFRRRMSNKCIYPLMKCVIQSHKLKSI